MDGIHDLGGMHGFGPVPVSQDYVFKERWQARAFALTEALCMSAGINADQHRRELERIPPIDYLSMDYFEKWIASTEALLIEKGYLTREELESGRKAFDLNPEQRKVFSGKALISAMLQGAPLQYPDDSQSRQFAVGGKVRIRDEHFYHHTRVPRYVRGKVGTIIADVGVFQFADSVAQDKGPDPKRCYTVEFPAELLWGSEAEALETVCVDMWEPYLERA